MKYDKDLIAEIVNLKMRGYKSRAIAAELGISKSGVNDAYNRWVEEGKLVLYNPEDVAFKQTKPKILFIDVESAADIAASFGRFKVNLSQDNIIREGGWLLSVAWRWNDEEQVNALTLTPQESVQMQDSRLLATIFDLMEQADFVVAHNADRFDIPLIKARMAINGFSAPRKVRVIDTLKIAKQMKFNSNKLDSLGEVLGVGRKLSHSGIKLWIDCQAGYKDALKTMRDYNVQDVELLYKVYHQIKHFDNKAPNMAAYYQDDKERCPVCGSEHVELTGNTILTNLSKFEEVHCTSCGARSRKRTNLLEKDKRKSLLSN